MYKLKKIILLSLIFCFLTAILGLIVLRASITNQNAQIQTGDQLAITSANLLAKEINAEIAGDLTVESLQDQHYSYGNTNNYNIGYNTGSGASIGAGYGKNNADSKWVNEQTTIIGTNSVNIQTQGETKLIGSLIANINENGIDTGNLAINAGILTYANLNDYDTSQNSGLNIAVSDIETENNHITGDAQIAIKNTGRQTEQTTQATIGSGSIIVGDNADTTALNRDITQTQTVTKDTITAALDAETDFDLRLLSEAGRQEIAEDFTNLPANLRQIGKGLTNNIISQSIKNAITDDSKNIIDTINQYITDDQKIALIQENGDLTQNLNGLTNLDVLYLQYALQNTADIAGANGEFTGDLQLYAMLNSGKGYAYTDSYGNTIGINTLKTDLANSADTINVLFHETTNYADHTQNEQTAINRGDTAQAIWVLKNFEKANTNTQTTEDWNDKYYNSPVILYGNLQYITADKDNINNFDPITTAVGAYLGYKAIESLIETGVEYGIAELTEDEEFNPFLSFGKNMAVNSTIGLIPGTSEAKLTTKAGIYFGKLTLRTAGDTAVDTITRDGDTSDYLITNTVGNIFGDIGGAVIKKIGKYTNNTSNVIKSNSLSNEAVRQWYHKQLDTIPLKIDYSLPLRERAIQAFKMRNEIKLKARELMADRASAVSLPAPKTLQDIVRKAYQQGLRGDEIWHYVMEGSQKSNSSIDAALGLTR